MTQKTGFPIKKEILQWALEESQKEKELVFCKFPKLEKWINEEEYPTFKKVEELANYLKIPFGYMFLDKAPNKDIMGMEFRSINNKLPQISKNLKDTIIDMDRKRNWMSDYRKKIGVDKLDIITKFEKYNRRDTKNNATHSKKLLGLDEYWYKSVKNLDEAIKLIRNKLEEAGILVMQNGVVGMSTNRPLNIDEFRAFMLYDEASPLIFINNNDSKAGKVFSLIHEYIHVLFKQEDLISTHDYKDNKDNERFINSITAEFLIPRDHINEYWNKTQNTLNQVNNLSNIFKVSQFAIAIKLKEMLLINPDAFEEIKKLSIDNFDKKDKRDGEGADFYKTYNSRNGKIFIKSVIGEAETGKISYTHAFKLLGGIGGKTYDQLKEEVGYYG